MLNLTRRPYEALVITAPDGSRLELTVLTVDGNHVKLGIEAPKSYVIDRYEVDHRKRREAAGEPIEGQEPRGPNWVAHKEREEQDQY